MTGMNIEKVLNGLMSAMQASTQREELCESLETNATFFSRRIASYTRMIWSVLRHEKRISVEGYEMHCIMVMLSGMAMGILSEYGVSINGVG